MKPPKLKFVAKHIKGTSEETEMEIVESAVLDILHVNRTSPSMMMAVFFRIFVMTFVKCRLPYSEFEKILAAYLHLAEKTWDEILKENKDGNDNKPS